MTCPLPDVARGFIERFGATVPIVNAPMAHVAGGALASAVASAGGLGLIGGGYGDLVWIRHQRLLAGHVEVGTGLITWQLEERPDLVPRLIDDGFQTFFLSFGDPTPHAPPILAAGGRLLCQVQPVVDGRRAVDAGAEAIVAQSTEAGGHSRDNAPLTRLVPAAVDAIAPVPVLAAGGLTDGADLARMWSLGAAGVLLGTRLCATPEALDSDAVKERLVGAGDSDTLRTSVFDVLRGPGWPAGFDGRALRNEMTDHWHGRIDELRAAADRERQRYAAAAQAHDLSQRVVWADSGVARVNDVRSAADLVREICLRSGSFSGPQARPATWSPTLTCPRSHRTRRHRVLGCRLRPVPGLRCTNPLREHGTARTRVRGPRCDVDDRPSGAVAEGR